MSTDYDAVCLTCKLSHHLGQRFLPGWAFGYGSGDIETQKRCGAFICDHAYHELRIFDTEFVPDDIHDIEDNEVEPDA